MYTIALLPLSALRDTFRSRAALQLELFALRHQLATMKRKSSRPSLRPFFSDGRVHHRRIGVYQVVEKYLRSRKGRKLLLDEINHVERRAKPRP